MIFIHKNIIAKSLHLGIELFTNFEFQLSFCKNFEINLNNFIKDNFDELNSAFTSLMNHHNCMILTHQQQKTSKP